MRHLPFVTPPTTLPVTTPRGPVRTSTTVRRLYHVGVALAVALFAAACSGSEDVPVVEDPPTLTPEMPVLNVRPPATPVPTSTRWVVTVPGTGATPGPAVIPGDEPDYDATIAAVLEAFQTEQARIYNLSPATPGARSSGRGGSSSARGMAPTTHWRGEYFNQDRPSGRPLMVRNDQGINFDWGTGAPAPGMPADGWAARWSRTVAFEAAAYRFRAVTDDGVKVTVGRETVINDFGEGPKDITVDVGLARGNHEVRVDYWEHAGNAYAKVWWERVDNPNFTDWTGEYFPNRDLSGERALVRNDKKISFRWKTKAPDPSLPADDFSVRWTRRFDFDEGRYKFTAQADDGIRVWIDGDKVLDKWGPSDGSETHTFERTLDGEKDIRVEYWDGHHNATVSFSWKKASSRSTSSKTDTPAPTSTVQPSVTAEPTATPTATGRPGATDTPTPTEQATNTPTSTPEPDTPTPTEEPTATEPATETPTPAPTMPFL